MPYQKRLISNVRAGFQTDLEPWLLPNDAYPILLDCFLWRGRILKRLGSKYIGQINRWTAVSLGTRSTDPQNFTGSFPTVPIIPGSVEIADPLFDPASSSVIYQDDGNGNLIAVISDTTPTVPVSVTGATSGASTVLNVASHPFSNGDIVWVLDVEGIDGINSVPATITANTPTSITVSVTTTGTWTSGGSITWYGGTVDYATGAIDVNFYTPSNGEDVAAIAKYYVYNPITGIGTKTTSVLNQEELIVFDYQKAYRFNNLTGVFDDISFDTDIATQQGPFDWNGNVNGADIMWTVNYANSLFATHGLGTDPIRYLATVGAIEAWFDFTPEINSTTSTDLQSCLMLFPYRGRFVALYTYEGTSGPGTPFPQRARWSQVGTPYYQAASAPDPFSFTADAWDDAVNGKGGFADAPTNDQIVSAEFINDVLIVFFEYSTWILRYTYDPQFPFVWERVNNDYGSECTFSTIPWKNNLYTVDLYGLTQTNGTRVERTDLKIPDEIFNIQNQQFEPIRVYGIRNYVRDLMYWTFPNQSQDSEQNSIVFPNRILVYNYLDESWAVFRDSYTCFGNWQPDEDLTWATATTTWEDTNASWSNPTGQTFDPIIVGGNQQGFVMQLDYDVGSQPSLVPGTLSLTGDTITVTMPNGSDGVTPTLHNLETGQFIEFSSLQGTNVDQLMGVVFEIQSTSSDGSSFTINLMGVTAFTYTPNSGYITVLIDFDIYTKRFNLALEQGLQTRIGYTDFYVDEDATGEFTVDIFVDEDDSLPVCSHTVSCAKEPPSNFTLQKVWKRDFENVIGQLFQYHIYQSADQMKNAEQDLNFVLHAMLLHIDKAGRLTY